ncbi:laccase [Suillus clintonianus]|uniref:laccase n=1 Tax=Suillus clintonianus TaxID=1904413 RepID=UPI001B879342|nr:laccase [Suillus clintonianus]KAG2130890.1 laccase [Suillus clintonianus]
MGNFCSISLLCLTFISACAALDTELIVSNAMIAPDGFANDAIVVNGNYPGPVLTAVKGERFQVNVTNVLVDESMNRSTSIHWHGINQYLSNEMDGTAMVTQCPIASGHSFVYNFMPVNQSGTFWYHSHLALQYCEGLRGPIVIYDPLDPYLDMYDVDDTSTILTISDWYHMNPYDVPASATPDAILINGRGRYEGGPSVPLSVLSVVQGKRYRIRLINMACKPSFVFSIDGHTFTVIEADSENTLPLTVDSIPILAGQRYSLILNANQTVDNYWIRANPSNYDSTFAGGLNSAILQYEGASERDPIDRDWILSNPLAEHHLHALESPEAPGLPEAGGADVSLNLVSVWDSNMGKFLINGYSYTPPTTPVLMQILTGQLAASQLQPYGSVYTLPANKIIELSIPGGQPEGQHPFHLHGHPFSVVRSAGSDVYNYQNPVRRDTTSNGIAGDNVTIRFRTDNSGPWLFHCHIDWHLELGMAVVFAEDADSTSLSVTPDVAAWKQLCPNYDD